MTSISSGNLRDQDLRTADIHTQAHTNTDTSLNSGKWMRRSGFEYTYVCLLSHKHESVQAFSPPCPLFSLRLLCCSTSSRIHIVHVRLWSIFTFVILIVHTVTLLCWSAVPLPEVSSYFFWIHYLNWGSKDRGCLMLNKFKIPQGKFVILGYISGSQTVSVRPPSEVEKEIMLLHPNRKGFHFYRWLTVLGKLLIKRVKFKFIDINKRFRSARKHHSTFVCLCHHMNHIRATSCPLNIRPTGHQHPPAVALCPQFENLWTI